MKELYEQIEIKVDFLDDIDVITTSSDHDNVHTGADGFDDSLPPGTKSYSPDGLSPYLTPVE